MTDIEKRLGEIREREARATDGPWSVKGSQDSSGEWNSYFMPSGWYIADYVPEEDIEFIINARSDIPFLLAQLEAARREVEELRKLSPVFVGVDLASGPDITICGNCDTALPTGCGGLFKGDGDCCLLNRTPAPQPQEGENDLSKRQ